MERRKIVTLEQRNLAGAPNQLINININSDAILMS